MTAKRFAGPPASAVRGRPDGFGRGSSPQAEATSDWLRRCAGVTLNRRRRAVGLSLAAAASLGVVALYQVGLLRRLPDLPLAVFDSEAVDASGEAYAVLDTPDATLGIASYAVTAALAAMGGADRARRRPWIPLLLAVKALSDATGAVALTVEQVSKHRRLCTWCTLAAAATVATVPQVLPEAAAAARQLCGRRGR